MSTVAVPGVLVTDREKVWLEEEVEVKPEKEVVTSERKTIFVVDEFCGFTDKEIKELSIASNGRIWREMIKANVSAMEKTVIKTEQGSYAVINGFTNIYKENRDGFINDLDSGRYTPGELYVSSKSSYDYSRIFDEIAEETENADVVYLSVSERVMPRLVNSVKLAIEQRSGNGLAFYHIDSHCVSGGYALLVLNLAYYDGTDFSVFIREERIRMAHLFTMRDFSYLLTSDKTLSLHKLMGVTATLAIKWAWLTVPFDGRIQYNRGATKLAKKVLAKTDEVISAPALFDVIQKDRGEPEKFDAILYLWANYYFNYRESRFTPVWISYTHEREKARADKLKEILMAAGANDGYIEVVQTPAVIAAMAGPTALGFYFLQKVDR